jgi:hypothetical protein
MGGLNILLCNTLYRHKAHVRPAHGFADRFGMVGVVLVALHLRFYELRWYQPDRIASRLQFLRPVMSTGTSFHANLATWLASGQHGIEPFCPAQTTLPHRFSRPINTV